MVRACCELHMLHLQRNHEKTLKTQEASHTNRAHKSAGGQWPPRSFFALEKPFICFTFTNICVVCPISWHGHLKSLDRYSIGRSKNIHLRAWHFKSQRLKMAALSGLWSRDMVSDLVQWYLCLVFSLSHPPTAKCQQSQIGIQYFFYLLDLAL
jgi:hypothetical protein